jgi:hypothetical protein
MVVGHPVSEECDPSTFRTGGDMFPRIAGVDHVKYTHGVLTQKTAILRNTTLLRIPIVRNDIRRRDFPSTKWENYEIC